MKIVAYGALGFIGSEVCRQLINNHGIDKIYIVDNNMKGYGTTNIIDLLATGKVEWFDIDLRYPNLTQRTILAGLTEKVDYVLNFASVIGGIAVFHNIPAQIIRDNSLINTTIMDLIVNSKRRPLYLYMSSSMSFEAAEIFPTKEEDIETVKCPKTSYGQSKLIGEWYCKAYAKEYGLRYVIVRGYNAIGPERPDPNYIGFSHVLPDLICKMWKGQGYADNPLEILGSGNQIRHLTDVRDLADGIITCLFNGKAVNQDFNISIPKGHTVKDMALTLWQEFIRRDLVKTGITKRETLYIKNMKSFEHDVQKRVPDTSKMKQYFGWEAKRTLESEVEGLVTSVIDLIEPKIEWNQSFYAKK